MTVIRPLIMPTLLLSSLSGSCAPQPLQSAIGRWDGVAQVGQRGMSLIVDISSFNGRPQARITVPSERVLRKELHNVEIQPPQVSFDIPFGESQAPFKGHIRGDSLVGTTLVGERSLQIRLHRKGPVPASPYREEEVVFANGNTTLRGSLLLPTTSGPHPAIVLIHGSSTPSRDDFRFYADLFVRRGIATLIYDKRDTGNQPGGMSRVDVRDLAADVLAALQLLKSRSDIDTTRIGLWGHSQGGWVAPIAAAQSNSFAFIVGFSAPGVTYAELDKYANAMRLRQHGFAQSDIDRAVSALTRVDEYVRRGGDPGEMQTFLDQMHQNRWAAFTTLPRRAPDRDDIATWLRWRNLDLDPGDFWRKVRSPVLLLYGERDDVVPVQTSVRRIQEALQQANNTNVTVKVFPGEGHTIMTSNEFVEVMADWVRQQVHR